jgi:hypothetical protein
MEKTFLEFSRKSLFYINEFLKKIDGVFLLQDGETYPPLFIIGVPRSGTTLTYQLITRYFDVGYLTRSLNYLYGAQNMLMRLQKPFLRRPNNAYESHYGKIPGILVPSESGTYWFQWFPRSGEMGNYVPADEINSKNYDSLRESINSLSLMLHRPMVFKSVYLSYVIGVLASVFPEARFVHVKRERFFVIQSIYQKRSRLGEQSEWWSVKPPGYKKMESEPLLRQVVWQVISTQKYIDKQIQRLESGRCFEVKYENICSNPSTVIERLGDWLKQCGYTRNNYNDLPASFYCANKVKLNDDLVAEISQEIARMEDTITT